MLSTFLATLVFAAGAAEVGPSGPSGPFVVPAAVKDGLPSKAPSEVGMSATRLQRIDRVLNAAIKAGGFPGGSVVIGRKGATVFEKGYGTLSWNNKTPVVASRTIYDLASLTKVVATTTAIMILYDQGKIRLDDPVRKYLPAFGGGAKDDVTIHNLLEHRSGLPAGRDLWRIALTPEEARHAAITTPLECQPGRCYIYSDLGPDLLGFIVEEVTGMALHAFVQQRVFEPLAMRDTYYRPHWTLRDRIAPTELTPPRGYPLRGEVHDENAFALGGVAGHAGLFSTATDLAVFAQMMLNGGEINGVRIVSDSAVALFTARTASRGTRALGWDTCGHDGSCGKYLSTRAFGHTGYTGTSMWIDPDRDLFVIVLTNRVHAARARRPAKVIADIRADVSDVAALSVRNSRGDLMVMPASFRADRKSGWNRVVRSRSSRSRRASSRKPTTKKPIAKKTATRSE
ncbi:MAG: serine hydrolase domain-containing protein [Gemmatimonadaceae bacterium]